MLDRRCAGPPWPGSAVPWRSSITGFFLLLSLLTACSSVPTLDVTPARALTQFEARSFDAAGLRTFLAQREVDLSRWPPPEFRVRELALTALYFNPTLSVARAQWLAADAEIVRAAEIPNPVFTITPQRLAPAAGAFPGWVVASSLIQIVETMGKRDLRIARARYLAEAARLDGVQSAWDVLAAVYGAHADLNNARRRLIVLEQQQLAANALKDVAAKQLIHGIGARAEVTQATAAASRVALEIETARGLIASSHRALASAVGMPLNALPLEQIAMDDADINLSATELSQIQSEAVLNRADMLARLADYAASDVALVLEGARRVPDLEIGPAYEYNAGEQKWGLSLSLPLPVFNQNDGAIKVARLTRQQNGDAFTAAQARVIDEVGRAVAAYVSARSSVRVAEEIAGRSHDLERVQQSLLEAGEADRAAYLTAALEAATATLAHIDAIAAAEKARLAVQTAGQRSRDGLTPETLFSPASG